MFLNRFVDLRSSPSLLAPLISTSLRIWNGRQIPSGALSYGIGAGKAIVSTPYWHASNSSQTIRELLFLLTIQTPSLAQSTNFCRTKAA